MRHQCNLLYQIIFQTTKIILPFITIPIVSKALGPEGLGVYNYTNSIAQYFVLLAGLGIGVYGNRQIAMNREDSQQLSKNFWELFFMSFGISLVALILYFIIVSFSADRVYFYYQSLIIIAAVVDVSWFFMGMEDFKKTSLSSIAAQLLSFILIVLFVKGPNDLGKYILIQGFNILFSQIVMWLFLAKYVRIVKVSVKGIFRHFVPAMSYFMPKVAIVLYTNLNKTILGWLDSNTAVGFYSNTLVLINILVTLITTVDLVLLPKMSHLFSKGKLKEIIKILSQSIHMQLFFTIPMMFGILLISSTVVPWFFGDSFLLLTKTIPLVSPLVVIIPLGMAIGRQYLIPMNKLRIYNVAVMLGAVVSIILNILLIPSLGLHGAIIATITAELFVTITRINAFIKETGFKFDLKLIAKFLFSAVVMYVIGFFITKELPSVFFTSMIQILIGVAIYMCMTIILNANPIISVIKNKLKN